MLCSICHQSIILSPSAKDRAKKFGGKPSDYSNLFTTHASCTIQRNKEETSDLIKKHLTSASQ